jgi:NitT/TauT family transport system ATP-binding protein
MPAGQHFAASTPAKLSVESVSKWFRTARATVHALDAIDLQVKEGEFVCLVGPSGCGKSTLLDIIAGLTMPDSGRVLADDQEVAGPGRHRLVMFQESALFPWLTVFGNVQFGLKRIPGMSRRERQEIADHHLGLVRLKKFKHSYVHELSGGMRQRVSIARALLGGPRVLLMDEPFGALDEITRDRLNEELLRIWRDTGTTIVFVTHSIYEAAFLGQQVLMMAARPGRVREIVSIDLPEPRHVSMRETAAFTAQAAHLRAVLETC